MSQVSAKIVLAQVGYTPPGGYVSGSVDNLLLNAVITASNANNGSVVSHFWRFVPNENTLASAWNVSGYAGNTIQLTPPASTGYGDAYLELTVTGAALPSGAANIATDRVILGIRAPSTNYTAGIPIPHYLESSVNGGAVVDPTKGRESRVAEIGFAVAKLDVEAGLTLKRAIVPILHVTQSGTQPSGSAQTLAAFRWDPALYVPAGAAGVSIVFKAILQTTNASKACNVDLFKISGNAIVTSSTLTSSSTSEDEQSVNLTSTLSGGGSAGLHRCRLYMTGTAGGDQVTCSNARIEVTWT